MATSKINIGASLKLSKSRSKRRSLPKARRHSKSLGPKSPMKGDRGKY